MIFRHLLRVWGVVFALTATVFLLAACGSSEPTPTPTSTDTESDGAPPDDSFEAQWQTLIEAAQAEGRLVAVMTGRAGPDAGPLYDHFGEKFGIRVTKAFGSGRESADRLLAEQGSGLYAVDTLHTGTETANTRLVPLDVVQPVEPWLFHPEVIDKSLWYQGRYWWNDDLQSRLFQYAASVLDEGTTLWFNSNLVSVEEIVAIDSWWDLLDEKWNGKVIARDQCSAGSGGGIVGNIIDPYRGPAWWIHRLTKMDVFFSGDPRYLEDSVVFGRFHMIGPGTGGTTFTALRDAGAPVIDRVTIALEHGLPISLSPGEAALSTGGLDTGIMIATNPPHPNVTKLWVNWLLSKEGQTLRHTTPVVGQPPEGHDKISLRVDITERGVTDPRAWRQPGVVYDTSRFDPALLALLPEAAIWLCDLQKAGEAVPLPDGLRELAETIDYISPEWAPEWR